MSRWRTKISKFHVPENLVLTADKHGAISYKCGMMEMYCAKPENYPDDFERVEDKPSRWQELKQAVRDCNRAARDAQAAADSWERMNDDIEARANEREFVQWDGGQDEMEILYDHLRDKAGFLGMTGLEMCYCGKMSSVIATKKRPTV